MAIKETETKKYDLEELSKFNETLNKFYILHTIPYAGNEVEVEMLDLKKVRDRFIASKPEAPAEARGESFDNLHRQWREWKFAQYFSEEAKRGEMKSVSHLQS